MLLGCKTTNKQTFLLCYVTITHGSFPMYSYSVCFVFAALDCPGRPGRPHVTKVSDSEIYQIWEEPESDGNSYILAYRVDWHRPGELSH